MFPVRSLSATGSLYDLPLTNIGSQDIAQKPFEGQVLLVVNVASHCGFTVRLLLESVSVIPPHFVMKDETVTNLFVQKMPRLFPREHRLAPIAIITAG
jgi:hypothetical protein